MLSIRMTKGRQGGGDESDDYANNEIFVIGGGEIFKLFLPLAERLYITKIDVEFEGDTVFPEINEELWKTVSIRKCESDEFNCEFTAYFRR
jgi:dihydrofolate reductase